MTSFKKVVPGDAFRFPAGLFNELVDLVGDDVSSSGTNGLSASTAIVVNIKNTTGSDRARFDCVSLGDPTFASTDGKADICFATTTADPWKKLAVLREPIADGKRGKAVIHGLTWCKVAGDAAHRYGFLDAANHRIKAATGGQVRLLGAPSSTPGLLPCLVGEHQRGWRFTLTGDMPDTDRATAPATLQNLDGTSTGLSVSIVSHASAFRGLVTGNTGLCEESNGVFRAVCPQSGIVDLRLSGNNLQYTFDGSVWITWHTATTCP